MQMLGMSDRDVQKMTVVLEKGRPPTIAVEEILSSIPDVLVTKTYTVVEVN